MRDLFHAELNEVAEQLIQMSEKVHEAISQASAALLNPDLPGAESVIAADSLIDQMQAQLDERSVLLLAQQAPVATDLRVVVSALRMSTTLERMGDLSGHVAKLARMRFPNHVVPAELRDDIEGMTTVAQRMTVKVTRILETRDLTILDELMKEDDLLDDAHRAMFDRLKDLQDSMSTETIIDMTLLTRYLERFGDHAVSLARRVEFLVTGEGERTLSEWREASLS